MKTCWFLDNPMVSLSTCHLFFLPWITFLFNLFLRNVCSYTFLPFSADRSHRRYTQLHPFIAHRRWCLAGPGGRVWTRDAASCGVARLQLHAVHIRRAYSHDDYGRQYPDCAYRTRAAGGSRAADVLRRPAESILHESTGQEASSQDS